MTDYPRDEQGERLPPSQPIPWKVYTYSDSLQLPTQNRAARRKARYRAKGKGRTR